MTEQRFVIETGSAGEFALLTRGCPEFARLRDSGERELSLFPYIFQDIFFSLFKENPRRAPLERLSTGARLNHLIIEQLMKSREYKKARAYTRQEPLGAGMAAMYFARLVLEGMDRGIVETANEIYISEEELRDALLQRKVAEKIVRIASEGGDENAAALYSASAEQWSEVIRDRRKRLRALAARLRAQWNTSGRKNIAFSAADAKGEKESRFETGSEGQSARRGVWTRGDLTPHLKLVETYHNSPKLKRLAQRVGRLKQVTEQRRGRSMMEDFAGVQGIEYGNDLALVVPEEWADYFNPARKAGFMKKFADEGLCMYSMKGKRRRGRGSMIICLDNSGSMQGPKEETSKAIAIALMEIAMAQKRDFVVIMFGGPDDEMKTFEVPGGRCTFDQLVAIGEHFLCSAGTDFEKPLREAVRYLHKDKYPGGDIVFISDGVCQVSPEFLEDYRQQKKMLQFRTIAVLVNHGRIPTASVEAFADELFESKDLKGLDVAGKLFGTMRTR